MIVQAVEWKRVQIRLTTNEIRIRVLKGKSKSRTEFKTGKNKTITTTFCLTFFIAKGLHKNLKYSGTRLCDHS